MKFPSDFVEQDGVFVPRHAHETIHHMDSPTATAADSPPSSDRQIEAALRSASDMSSMSVEVRNRVRDWPSRYHLSANRSNLLRCLSIDPRVRVLEIGAGCGAITRYLGENVREVWALEGDLARARLCHLRCRGLPHVKVLAAKPCQLELTEEFDLVTLIGVLAHAGDLCKEGRDPFRSLLETVSRRLRPGGQLVLAIENQLGIKYFSGCGEDHGEPRFSGLEGYPEETGVRTFGKVELLSLLSAAGFNTVALILPFPDYKVPNSLINAEYANAEGALRFGLADWCRTPFEEYGTERGYLFDDHLVLAEIAKNGLLADHANSFLVVATRGTGSDGPPVGPLDWVAQRYYATRHPSFCTKTVLRLVDDKPEIVRMPLASPSSAVAVAPAKLEHLLTSTPFLEGSESMALAMVRALRKVRGAEEAFTSLLYEWVGMFREEDAVPGNSMLLRGEFLDCIPDNLLRVGKQGPWRYVDREWRWTDPVALDWLFYRGLLSFWSHHRLAIAGSEARRCGSFERFVSRCFDLMNSALSAEEIDALREQEEQFRRIVRHGADAAHPANGVDLGQPHSILEWMIPGRTSA